MKLVVIYSVLIALFMVSSCGSKDETITPEVLTITESVYASGVVLSANQHQIHPKVTGVVEEVLVKEGDTISKGQPIMLIQNETAKLNKENAQLVREYATINANSNRIREAKISIELAKKRLQNDSVNLARRKDLYESSVGSQAELENAQLMYENSSTSYKSALLAYRNLIKDLNFNAEQAEKNLRINETLLKNFMISSTMDGKIYALTKQEGELVSPQTPVATVGDNKQFVINLQVDEYDIVKIKKGQYIAITMDSYREQVFEATVTRIQPVMNERSKTFLVEAMFLNAPEVLYPYLTVEANITIKERKDVLCIPRNYLLDDKHVIMASGEKREVVVGLMDYEYVEIVEGLSDSDKIKLPE